MVVFEFGKHMVVSRHVVKMRVNETGRGFEVELMLSGRNLLVFEHYATRKEAEVRLMEIAEIIGDSDAD